MCPADFFDQRALLGKSDPVLGGAHLVRQAFERVLGHVTVLLCTQYELDRRILACVDSFSGIETEAHLGNYCRSWQRRDPVCRRR